MICALAWMMHIANHLCFLPHSQQSPYSYTPCRSFEHKIWKRGRSNSIVPILDCSHVVLLYSNKLGRGQITLNTRDIWYWTKCDPKISDAKSPDFSLLRHHFEYFVSKLSGQLYPGGMEWRKSGQCVSNLRELIQFNSSEKNYRISSLAAADAISCNAILSAFRMPCSRL